MGKDLAFIDFETTGLSPERCDRVIEVGVAVLTGRRIVDGYQSLVNPDRQIPGNVEDLTGINDEMVESAPRARAVMREVLDFVGELPLVAHNAAFDRRFYDMELGRIRASIDTDQGINDHQIRLLGLQYGLEGLYAG